MKTFAIPNDRQQAVIQKIAGGWSQRTTWAQDGYIVLRGSSASGPHYWIAEDGAYTVGRPQ